MSRLVCLLEPCGAVAAFLRELKEEAYQRARVELPYLDHPPHATLVVGPYGDPWAWKAALQSALSECAPFVARVDGWRVFEQDALAGGGDTLALSLVPDAQLFELQQTVANVVRTGMKTTPQVEALPGGLQQEPFATSWKRYGYPFVGNHWLPHATLASFPATERSLLEQFRAREVAFDWPVERVTVMRVVGDDHEPCFQLAMG